MQFLLSIVILVFLVLNLDQGSASRYYYRNDSTQEQLNSFAERVGKPIGIMTTSSGYPVPFQDIEAINTNLLFNQYFLDSLSHLSGERIPERVVHAKGTGAFGYFKVTHDLSDVCKAKLFSKVGETTPLVARFSSVVQRIGGSDVARENRGFAVKFYTKEGNYDFLAINIPMFQIKDPNFFATFVHSFNKNPVTIVVDDNSRWDHITQRPETLNFFLLIFGTAGIPDGYRYMPGFTVHTFELLNDAGKRTFGRFHLLPDLGIRNLTTAQANRITDTDYAVRDLYNAIANGNFPTWTLNVQTIPEDEVKYAKFDIFDVTLAWPVKLYPLRPIGTLVLNRNPENQFAEIEQLAFNPGNLVPGVRGIDSLFESRILSYRLSHMHRLGENFNRIRINCPFRAETRTYNRDGFPPVKDNGRDSPNYFPNSFHGPIPYVDNSPPRISVYTDPRVTNFNQARETYIQMTEDQKCELVQNVATSLSNTETFLQERVVKLFKDVHKDLGGWVQYALKNGNSCS